MLAAWTHQACGVNTSIKISLRTSHSNAGVREKTTYHVQGMAHSVEEKA